MGSFSRQRAANRFQTAFQQRLDAASDPNEAQQAYDDAIEGLVSIAIDETELDRDRDYDVGVCPGTLDSENDTTNVQFWTPQGGEGRQERA
jgi:hypothetical protein